MSYSWGYGRRGKQDAGVRWGMGRGAGGRWRVSEMPPLPPPPRGVLRVAASTENDRGLDAPISYRFARAPFITVVDLEEGRVIRVQAIRNTLAGGARGVGMAVGQWLLSSNVNVVIAPRFGPNVSLLLNQAGVRVEIVPPGTLLGEAIRGLGLSR